MTDLKPTMALVSELNASHGVTQRGGKKYTQVVHRMEAFRQMHGTEYGVDTHILVDDGQRVVVKAKITNMDGVVIGAGMAEEIRGQGNVNKTSALENCETSAIGRALASLGLAGGEYASANEMDGVGRKEEAIASMPPPKQPPASLLELQQQANDFLPEFDLKQTKEWVQADFTKKYMEIANKEFPEIYQDIKSKSQERMKVLKEKELKQNG
jgi:hypothetical protein|tara:strand:- start:4839 stop:5474 length:636 start_codon:yes stop_codon:yes gene_type:complete